jgi:hypothetical protein
MMAACAIAPETAKTSAYAPAGERLDSLIEQLRAPKTRRMTEDQVENPIGIESRELMRRLLQAHLNERGPGRVSEPVIRYSVEVKSVSG